MGAGREVIRVSSFKFEIDPHLHDKVMQMAKQSLQAQKYEVTCPYCDATREVRPGKSTCPLCGKEIDLELNISEQ